MAPAASSRMIRRILILGLCWGGILFPAGAQDFSHRLTDLLRYSGFDDNYEVRRQLTDDLYASSPRQIESPKKVYTQAASDKRVMFDVRRTADHFYLCFINEMDFRFPLLSRGTWIVKKEIETGRFVQAKIFLHDEEGSYLRVFPFEDRSRMDFYLFGKQLYRDVMIPLPFEQLLTMPFSRLVSLTEGSVDWSLFFPDTRWEEWEWTRDLVQLVRSRLDQLPHAPDGALNEECRFVVIETGEEAVDPQERGLNCSGFVKWVTDGIIFPLIGTYTSVEELKERHRDIRGSSWSETREESRDPYFGLDWTRNLAAKVYEAYYGRRPAQLEINDIRQVPFFTYKEDAGFKAEDLKAVVYQAASRNGGSLFLASVSAPYLPSGEEVTLRQHVHVAAILPYFDQEGQFHGVVFDTNEETSLDNLASRYPDSYIHLVRIPLRGRYQLPVVE